jgi:hypothetical protein
MNISKRTWIIALVAILLFVAALLSLYMEKEEEIKLLEEISDEPVKRPKKEKIQETEPIKTTDNESGTEQQTA